MFTAGLQVYDQAGPNGRLLADWSPFVEDLEIARGKGGAWYVSGFIPYPVEVAASWYRLDQLYDLRVTPGIWNGRLSKVRLVNQGIEFTAKGYYRALRDPLYTAFWSLSGPSAWRVLNQDDNANADPTRYYVDFTNRIYIAANKNAELDQNHWAGVGYRPPYGSNTEILRATFDYELFGPTGSSYRAEFRQRLFDWTNVAPSLWSLATDGTTQTGSQDISITSGAAVSFMLYRASPTPEVYTGETGEFYLKITNLRIYGRDGTEVRADHILGDLVTFVNGKNPGQLRSSLHMIEDSAIDFENEVYEDARPLEIVDYLSGVGDDQGRAWEAGVTDDRYFFFRPRGSLAKTYYVYVEDFALAKDVENYYNRAYATYRAAAGDNLRTAAAEAVSLEGFGVTLEDFVDVNTESATVAAYYRDTLLNDGDRKEPVSSISVTAVHDDRGALVPLWLLQPGDVVAIRNVPDTQIGQLASARLTIQSVILKDTDGTKPPELIIEPEEPEDALDFLIARQAAGIGIGGF